MRSKNSSSGAAAVPHKLFFNYLKTTKIGLAFEIMIPLIMVYFVLGALQHKIGGQKKAYSISSIKPGAASSVSSLGSSVVKGWLGYRT